MGARMDLAVNKSCDGVDPSNVEVMCLRGLRGVSYLKGYIIPKGSVSWVDRGETRRR